MTRIVITGAKGRMGQTFIRLIGASEGLELAGVVERPGHPDLGSTIGACELGTDLSASLGNAEVVIDFTAPDASAVTAAVCAKAGVAAVFGTTGLTETHKAAIAEAAKSTPIVLAPNMSAGVNVTYRLVSEAKRLLGDSYKSAIFETHHRFKKDAPSGTALKLAEIAKVPREEITAIRGGDVVGEHTVFFLADGERIEITHRATNRDCFAHGALRAARWVVGKPARIYEMSDVLGL